MGGFEHFLPLDSEFSGTVGVDSHQKFSGIQTMEKTLFDINQIGHDKFVHKTPAISAETVYDLMHEFKGNANRHQAEKPSVHEELTLNLQLFLG